MDFSTDKYEAIYYSDLYIPHLSTSAVIPMAFEKQMIAINFTRLEFLTRAFETLGVSDCCESFNDFKKKLQDFQKGRLKPSYDTSLHILEGKTAIGFLNG